MTKPNNQSNGKYGFLAVTEVSGLGYCGGLLLLSDGGRPLEFHCTSPVNANRAQQILYGETLKEYLVCDQIGVALVKKVRGSLGVLVIDAPEMTALSRLIQTPVVLLHGQETEQTTATNVDVLEMAGQSMEVHGAPLHDVEGLVRKFMETLPLSEPFERIYQAIDEAHSVAA